MEMGRSVRARSPSITGRTRRNSSSTLTSVAPGRVVFLLSQICRGLREAHSVGMIHRDIRPSNMMATTRGGLQDVAKLLDFGLVLGPDETGDTAKLTREGAIIGTPHYMSPERRSAKSIHSYPPTSKRLS